MVQSQSSVVTLCSNEHSPATNSYFKIVQVLYLYFSKRRKRRRRGTREEEEKEGEEKQEKRRKKSQSWNPFCFSGWLSLVSRLKTSV